MNKKYFNIIYIALNAITLTLFSWLQICAFSLTMDVFGTGMFVTMFSISVLAVPLISWGTLYKLKK